MDTFLYVIDMFSSFASVLLSLVSGILTASQGAPIAGYILDASGGEGNGVGAYRPAIFYAGGMALSSAAMALFIRLKTDVKPFKRL